MIFLNGKKVHRLHKQLTFISSELNGRIFSEAVTLHFVYVYFSMRFHVMKGILLHPLLASHLIGSREKRQRIVCVCVHVQPSE